MPKTHRRAPLAALLSLAAAAAAAEPTDGAATVEGALEVAEARMAALRERVEAENATDPDLRRRYRAAVADYNAVCLDVAGCVRVDPDDL